MIQYVDDMISHLYAWLTKASQACVFLRVYVTFKLNLSVPILSGNWGRRLCVNASKSFIAPIDICEDFNREKGGGGKQGTGASLHVSPRVKVFQYDKFNFILCF